MEEGFLTEVQSADGSVYIVCSEAQEQICKNFGVKLVRVTVVCSWRTPFAILVSLSQLFQ